MREVSLLHTHQINSKISHTVGVCAHRNVLADVNDLMVVQNDFELMRVLIKDIDGGPHGASTDSNKVFGLKRNGSNVGYRALCIQRAIEAVDRVGSDHG